MLNRCQIRDSYIAVIATKKERRRGVPLKLRLLPRQLTPIQLLQPAGEDPHAVVQGEVAGVEEVVSRLNTRHAREIL